MPNVNVGLYGLTTMNSIQGGLPPISVDQGYAQTRQRRQDAEITEQLRRLQELQQVRDDVAQRQSRTDSRSRAAQWFDQYQPDNNSVFTREAIERAQSLYVRQYPLAELQPPAQVLVDNGMVIRDPTGWEIFQHQSGGYGLCHDAQRDRIIHYPEHSGAFTAAWETFQQYVATERERLAGAE